MSTAHEFTQDDAGAMLRDAGFESESGSESDAHAIAGQLYSAFVRATKPA